MRYLLGMLMIAILIGGCSHTQENGQESTKKPNVSEPAEKQEQKEQIASSSTELTPPKGLKLKEDRDGIVPYSIEIPALDVKTTIEKVGTLENGQMGVPKSFDTVGWFGDGSQPGSPGNAVMAGHVDSKTGPAIFYKLDELEQGDEIIVKDKDGKSLTFEVTGKESYDRKNAPVNKIFDYSYTSKLNLITCTGDFNRDEGTHEERLVVFTELKKS
ncbi:class F sortase [Fictibacillus nanhaiensis]|uniref:class F sortase n=1 Tax=Fictibacillus nanhaiensis TaxID=742169 RepID=UPI001C980C4F|nr:class F sortase [Fictibacillus nanhaiensis]MBY6037348.1 class F sortase [Fictibacillus nanhaiensis]